jgi:uncharacterized ferritin-like protein (DUF455 family)
MKEFFSELERILLLDDASQKCLATQTLAKNLEGYFESSNPKSTTLPINIPLPGYPDGLHLVAPRELKRRGISTQEGRNVLMHAVAHIEFNAINLALDAAYRFRQQPLDYYRDWISVAADEARHFGLIRDYLNNHDCDYADLPAHNGLWEMAVKTADDVVARMALVPRVLEARGLDVTPKMIERLKSVGDLEAVAILNVIYQDEITHVRIGSDWFSYLCERTDLEPRTNFIRLVKKYFHGELKGPFNIAARLQAGFDENELRDLELAAGISDSSHS